MNVFCLPNDWFGFCRYYNLIKIVRGRKKTAQDSANFKTALSLRQHISTPVLAAAPIA
jgi:hypothetical protein